VLPDNTLSPPAWTLPPRWDTYLEIRDEQTHFWEEFLLSAVVSLLTTALTVTVAFMAAYGLARSTFKFRTHFVHLLFILACLPPIAYVLPLREIYHLIRLQDTFWGVTLAETALFAPLATYILYGSLAQLSIEAEESARLDGASLPLLLTRIILPILSPVVLATAVLVFVLSWNQFILPLVLTDIHVKVLPVQMRDFFTLEREFEWPKAAAVIILSLLPAAIFVAAAHRALEQLRLDPL
jgi:ABC-type glycerol-3-phosphate transport system permease component